MFKNFMQIFSPKYFARMSCDSRKTFVQVLRTCRCEIFVTLVGMSYDSGATVLRKHANTSPLSGEKIKLSEISTNVVTLSRMSRDCRTNEN